MNRCRTIDFAELETEKYWSYPASSRRESKDEIKKMILSGKYIGSRKIDGHYFRFTKDEDGVMHLNTRSRGKNGSFTDKIGHVPHLHDFFGRIPNGSCLIGELYIPEHETASEVNKVIGASEDKAVQIQTDTERRLHYYVFDIWQWNGESLLEMPAEERFEKLGQIAGEYADENVRFARYCKGRALMDELEGIFEQGGEGIVMTKADSKPEPGKRTSRKTIKVKKEIRETIDVIILGTNPPTREYAGKAEKNWMFWEDGEAVTRNYALGLPGSLRIGVMRNGEAVEIGAVAGLPDDVLENADRMIGQVAEISCMEIHKTGGLRHPVFIGLRPDLSETDCEYAKVYAEEGRR